MILSGRRGWLRAALVATTCVGIRSLASAEPVGPGAADLALRDAWVASHLPYDAKSLEKDRGRSPSIAPGTVVLRSYDRVFRNEVPGKGLAIAGRSFPHGIYCHAPTRLRVVLPGPARAFSATVGVLTNPASRGGSIVFSVKAGSTVLYTSPVMHREEPGVAASAELGGATELLLELGDAGDGIISDQGVWGEATVTLIDGRVLRLGELPLREAWVAERTDARLPFSFVYDGRSSDELLPHWDFSESAVRSDPDRVRRERSYKDPDTGLCVRCAVVEYTEYPIVEWTLRFVNTGDRDTPILSGIQPLDAIEAMPPGEEATLHYIDGDSCTPDSYRPRAAPLRAGDAIPFASHGGRPTTGGFPYWNLMRGSTEQGLIAVLGWPGQWSARFERADDGATRIRAGQEWTHFRLRPGEEARSPLAVLQFHQGDWLRGQNIWRRWMVAHNIPKPRGRLVPTHYGTCWSVDLHPDAATERTILDGYVRERIPIEYYFIDAGWFPGTGNWYETTGTWEVDRTRFPNGIREVSDHARANGMKFVLWFEPERAWAGSWLAERHPEWILGGKNGGLVHLGNPDAWRWVVDRIDALIRSEGVDVYRQDFNLDPLPYWRGADSEDREGLTEIAHVDGYLRFWDELTRRNPGVWIDSCASGGRRNDLETMRRSVPLLRSDYFHEPESQQGHTYGLSLWLPYHGSGLGATDPYFFRSCIFPASRVGWDTRKVDMDYALLRRMIAEFKRVEPYLLSDYYPLTPYDLDKKSWMAWQLDDPERGGGAIQVFRRAECADGSITIRLRGLDPESTYSLESLDGLPTQSVPGDVLLREGLRITIDGRPGSALLVYQRVNGAK